MAAKIPALYDMVEKIDLDLGIGVDAKETTSNR